MPTAVIDALLRASPDEALHEGYADGAFALFKAYQRSGRPFLAIDYDRAGGFTIPDDYTIHTLPSVVDLIKLSIDDFRV